MKRFFVVFAVALAVAGAAVAAVTQRDPGRAPTTASLAPAYVQAARYWSARAPVSAEQSPPTTASLMSAYVQAAALWRH